MSEEDPLGNLFARWQLHFAAEAGDVARVTELIAEGHSLDTFDDLSRTPLHYAAIGGHLEVMRLLIAAGANVNAHDESMIGETTLGQVSGSCSFEVAELLVKSGANPTIAGWMQLTALHRSGDRKKPEGVRVHRLLEEAAKRFR